MLLEAEMESKERIEKWKFFNKSEEFLLIAEASQEEQSFDLSQKLSEENDDYFYQFENYKMSCELDNNGKLDFVQNFLVLISILFQ